MSDYEAIRKDLYERFHDAIQKLYVSELKDQIADKDELITAQDHMIADQADRIEHLEAALREIAKHPRGGVINTPEKMDRDEFIGIARAALGKSK